MKEFEPNLERLFPGQVVYFAEPNNEFGRMEKDSTLVTKNASVDDSKRTYPVVILWRDLKINPNGVGLALGKSPKELFTKEEVMNVLNNSQLGIEDIDAFITDPQANRRLAFLLARTVQERLSESK